MCWRNIQPTSTRSQKRRSPASPTPSTPFTLTCDVPNRTPSCSAQRCGIKVWNALASRDAQSAGSASASLCVDTKSVGGSKGAECQTRVRAVTGAGSLSTHTHSRHDGSRPHLTHTLPPHTSDPGSTLVPDEALLDEPRQTQHGVRVATVPQLTTDRGRG